MDFSSQHTWPMALEKNVCSCRSAIGPWRPLRSAELMSAFSGRADTLSGFALRLRLISRPDCCLPDPTGKTPKTRRLLCPTCQARSAKIYLFPKQRNYEITKSSRPHEGRFAIVTIRGAGCDGRGRAARRAARRVRSSRVVLSPRRWGQANGIHSRRRLSSPVLRGERGAAVKPLRRECRSCRPACIDLWAFSFSAHEACGCGQRPAFPAPSVLGGTRMMQSPDASAPRG
jgi:hypothetical protein